MANDYPVGNRYAKHPRQSRNPNKYPENRRWRCMDCGAVFHARTQMTQFDLHCSVMAAGKCHRQQRILHHGWRAVGQMAKFPDKNLFRNISDSKRMSELDDEKYQFAIDFGYYTLYPR